MKTSLPAARRRKPAASHSVEIWLCVPPALPLKVKPVALLGGPSDA